MRKFEGKTAVITGASSGIGESCARKFVAAGARVVLAARSAEPLQRLVEELGADVAHAVPTDVSNLGACEHLIEEAKTRFGSIDILVNNAGYNSRGPLEELPMDVMLQILDVNLRGPMMLTKLALPHMRSQDSGTIVNVASLAGRFPLDDEATYSTTKFGLRIFSFAVAEELRNTNVRISVVSSGPVETGFILDQSIIETVPPARLFSTDEHSRRNRRPRARLGGRWPQRAHEARFEREDRDHRLSRSRPAQFLMPIFERKGRTGEKEIPRAPDALINRFRVVAAAVLTSALATVPKCPRAAAFCRGASGRCCAARCGEAA